MPGEDYLAAAVDPLRDCAPAIVEDMNQLMFEDIQRFPRVLAGADKDIDVARITWVDRLGFNLQVLYHEPKVRPPSALSPVLPRNSGFF